MFSRHLMFLLLCAFCCRISTAGNDTHTTSVKNLEQCIKQIIIDAGSPAMGGAVVIDGEVVWQGAFGIAERETGRPATSGTLFRIGSVSKTFVSLAVLRLVEQQKLSLEARMQTLVPEAKIENQWEDTHPVLLHHVLEHTAGFDDIHPRVYDFSDPDVTTLGGIEFSNSSLSSRWHPGTRYAYSNIGPATAALAVEKVTGKRYEDFVQQEILRPMEMDTATFFPGPNLAWTYRENGERRPYQHISARSAGAMNLTPRDMAKVLRMFIGRGKLGDITLLTTESLLRMETPSTTLAAATGLQLGQGLGNFKTYREGFVWQGHTGGITGSFTRMEYLPEYRRGYFFTVTDRDVIGAIEDEITSFITAGLTPPVAVPSSRISGKKFKDKEGLYQYVSPRMELLAGMQRLTDIYRVSVVENELEFGGLQQVPVRFEPVTAELFIKPGNPLPTIAFVEDPQGRQLLQTHLATYQRVPAIVAYGRKGLLGLSGVLIVSAFLWAPVWIVQLLKKRKRNQSYLMVQVLPLTTILVLLATVICLTVAGQGNSFARATPWTIGFFAGSIVFPVLALISLIYLFYRFPQRRQVGHWAWYYCLMVSTALVTLALFMYHWGWLGLRTWIY